MSTPMFNTGNPIGSVSPEDRSDNTQVFDNVMNGEAKSYVNRLGKLIYSLAWMQTAATGIPAVQAAIDAQSARDAILLSNGGIYTTVAEGLAATAEGKYFNVLDTDPRGYLILYQKVGGVQVEKKRWPSSLALNEILSLIRSNEDVNNYLTVVSDTGGVMASFYESGFDMPQIRIEAVDGRAVISDETGALYFYHDDKVTIAGHMEFGYTGADGLFVVDEFNNVINDLGQPLAQSTEVPEVLSPTEGDILFCNTIATSEKFKAAVYPRSMLKYRERADGVIASVEGLEHGSSTGVELPVSAKDMGASATFTLRDSASNTLRKMKTVKLVDVPDAAPGTPVNVLMIGDSICNRQGAQFTKQALEAMGYAPSFIGVMHGSGSPTNTADATGPLGEGREGWETGDFTYWETNRVLEVAPGTEEAFLNMAKTAQARYNGFIRPATGADPAELIRNGMIFDFAYYLSRFNFAAPDVVTITLGTNDGRDLDASVIRQVFKDNLTIMISQIFKAVPSAKIILGMPGTGYDEIRRQMWTEEYTQMIAVFGELEAAYPGKITVAPLWAMCNHETGYNYAFATTSPDGFVTGRWSDSIHPVRNNRRQLYTSLAPFIAAAKQNLI